MQISKDLKIEDIEFKKYLSLVEKQLLANKIIDSCIITDDVGLNRIDYFYKYLTTQVSLIINYTSLEFTENLIEDFDCLAENGLLEDIIKQIPGSEIEVIMDIVEDELYQMVKLNNSVESILAKNLQQLIDKLPTDKQLKSLSKTLVKDINKLDWNKVPMLRDMWLNANGKSGDGVG